MSSRSFKMIAFKLLNVFNFYQFWISSIQVLYGSQVLTLKGHSAESLLFYDNKVQCNFHVFLWTTCPTVVGVRCLVSHDGLPPTSRIHHNTEFTLQILKVCMVMQHISTYRYNTFIITIQACSYKISQLWSTRHKIFASIL